MFTKEDYQLLHYAVSQHMKELKKMVFPGCALEKEAKKAINHCKRVLTNLKKDKEATNEEIR